MPSPRRHHMEDVDLSSIQPPVKLGVTGAEQVARCLAAGSDEIKHLLRQECRIIFECCACTSLFRSLANFLAHKRVYCKEDHLLPSSDLASHVSILRQYIQTKAAAMATLAEGASNIHPSLNDSQIGESSPDILDACLSTNTESLENGMRTDETKTEVAGHGDTPKKKKSKLPTLPIRINLGSRVDSESDTGRLVIPKKKRTCDHEANHFKKSNSVKKKSVSEDRNEALNGSVNIADTFLNEEIELDNSESSESNDAEENNANNDNIPKDNGVSKTSVVGGIKPQDCSVVMGQDDVVKQSVVDSMAEKEVLGKATVKVPKAPKKDMAPHLLYPCLYCDHVFPGTRMAIDHISAIHKKRKAINVSKIRTKIRKKAFVVKSGKKMRRFQKKNKPLEKNKGKEEETPKVDENCKIGKRGHVSHKCPYCSKTYLYKTALERHQEGCRTRQQSVCQASRGGSSVSPVSSPTAPLPMKAGKSASGSTSLTGPKADKKTFSVKSPSSVVSPSLNCRVLGELVISPCDAVKAEPESPFRSPQSSSVLTSADQVSTSSSTAAKDNESPFNIPVRSEYPCPYCICKPRKSFETLFQHISEKHKDLRPSRKRVARFLMNSGYKCSSCKSPPRFFKNRVMLRRHREREHGMSYSSSEARMTGKKGDGSNSTTSSDSVVSTHRVSPR